MAYDVFRWFGTDPTKPKVLDPLAPGASRGNAIGLEPLVVTAQRDPRRAADALRRLREEEERKRLGVGFLNDAGAEDPLFGSDTLDRQVENYVRERETAPPVERGLPVARADAARLTPFVPVGEEGRLGPVGRTVGRGLAESGHATVAGAAALGRSLDRIPGAEYFPLTAGLVGASRHPEAQPEALEAEREGIRYLYGDPQDGAELPAYVASRLGGDLAQFAAPGTLAAKAGVLPAIGAGGLRGIVGRTALNAATSAPLTAAQAGTRENSSTAFLADATESPFLDRLASSVPGRVAGDVGLDLLASGALEGVGAGMRAANSQAQRAADAVRRARERRTPGPLGVQGLAADAQSIPAVRRDTEYFDRLRGAVRSPYMSNADVDAVVEPLRRAVDLTPPPPQPRRAQPVREDFTVDDFRRRSMDEADGVAASQLGGAGIRSLTALSGAGIGAATGAAVNDEDPLSGALAGGLAGFGAGAALPSALERLRPSRVGDWDPPVPRETAGRIDYVSGADKARAAAIADTGATPEYFDTPAPRTHGRPKGEPLPLPPMDPVLVPQAVEPAWREFSARYPRIASRVTGLGAIPPGRSLGRVAEFDPQTGVINLPADNPAVSPAELFHEGVHVAQDARRQPWRTFEDALEAEQYAQRANRSYDAATRPGSTIPESARAAVGGGIGAGYGIATGEDTEDRIARGIAYGLLGAGGGMIAPDAIAATRSALRNEIGGVGDLRGTLPSREEFLGSPFITKSSNASDLRPYLRGSAMYAEPEPFMEGRYTIRRGEGQYSDASGNPRTTVNYVVMDGETPVASYDGNSLVVAPRYRRQGIATELVADLRGRHPEVPPADYRTPASQRVQERAYDLLVARQARESPAVRATEGDDVTRAMRPGDVPRSWRGDVGASRAYEDGIAAADMGLSRSTHRYAPESPEAVEFERGWRSRQRRTAGAGEAGTPTPEEMPDALQRALDDAAGVTPSQGAAGPRYAAQPAERGRWRVIDTTTGRVEEEVGGIGAQRTAESLARRYETERGLTAGQDAGPLAGTRVVDESGTPRTVYHGTSRGFDEFDPTRLDADAQYGPGLYFTESPVVAGGGPGVRGYANERGSPRTFEDAGGALAEEGFAPNVRPARLAVRNPFDIDATYSLDEMADIFQRAGVDPQGTDFVLQFNRGTRERVGGDYLYTMLERAFGNDRAAANAGLRAAGYDGITHIGGGLTGTDPHRVWIAFDREQVRSAFGPAADAAQAGNTSLVMMRATGGAGLGGLTGYATGDEDDELGRAGRALAGAVAGAGVGMAPEALRSMRRVAGNEEGALGLRRVGDAGLHPSTDSPAMQRLADAAAVLETRLYAEGLRPQDVRSAISMLNYGATADEALAHFGIERGSPYAADRLEAAEEFVRARDEVRGGGMGTVRRVAGNEFGALGDPADVLVQAIGSARQKRLQGVLAGLEATHPNLRGADGAINYPLLSAEERAALREAEAQASLGGAASTRDMADLASGQLSPDAFAAKYGISRKVARGYQRHAASFADAPDPMELGEVPDVRPERPDFEYQPPPEPRPFEDATDDSFLPPDAPERRFGSGSGQLGHDLLSPQGIASMKRTALLTNPVGRFRDFLDNVGVMAPAETASTGIASVLDVLTERLPGMQGGRTQAFNVRGAATAAGKAATDGMRDMGRVIVGKPGRSRASTAADDAAARATDGLSRTGGADADVDRVVMANPLLDAWARVTGRVTGAVDRPAAVYAYERAIAEQAKVVALNERTAGALPKTRSAMRARIDELTAAPTPEMEALATAAVQHATFTNDSVISKGIQGLREALQEHPWAQGGLDFFITTWRRTPGASAGKQLEYSPLGSVKMLNDAVRLYQLSTGRSGSVVGSVGGAAVGAGLGALTGDEEKGRNAVVGALLGAAGGRAMANMGVKGAGHASVADARRAMTMTGGRVVTGTSIMALGALLASEGKMTGVTLSNQDRQNGAKPLSILIGGRWWPVGFFPPVGLGLAIGAEYHNQGGASAARGLVAKTGEAAALRSVSDIREATRNEKGQARLVESVATSFMPPVLGQVAQTIDPVQRAPETAMEAVQSRIPIASRGVPARQDAFGRDVPADGLPLLDPTRSTRDRRSDRLLRELDRIGAAIPLTQKADDIEVLQPDGTVKVVADDVRTHRQEVGRVIDGVLRDVVLSKARPEGAAGEAWDEYRGMEDIARRAVAEDPALRGQNPATLANEWRRKLVLDLVRRIKSDWTSERKRRLQEAAAGAR